MSGGSKKGRKEGARVAGRKIETVTFITLLPSIISSIMTVIVNFYDNRVSHAGKEEENKGIIIRKGKQ